MSGRPLLKIRSFFSILIALLLLIAVACGGTATTPDVAQEEAVNEAVVANEAAAEVPKNEVVDREATNEVVNEAVATAVPEPAAESAAKVELDRVVIAIPLPGGGSDTNITWVTSRGGTLDVRPALEHLVGNDRIDGAYEPQLAESWESSTDFSTWTLNLRQGVPFHYDFGEFTAKDLRHSLFLITQDDAVVTDAGSWRKWVGSTPAELEQNVEIVDDYTVKLHLNPGGPEQLGSLSVMYGDLMIHSKDFWDAEGKAGYTTKVVGTGAFELVERKLGQSLHFERVENHWRHTPEFKELEFRWSQEAVTRLAALLTGEVQMAAVDRSLQQQAIDSGLKVVSSHQPGVQNPYQFGGLYFATPDRLQPDLPFNKKEVRQAINMAINRNLINQELMAGKGELVRVNGYHPVLDEVIWPGVWNSRWDQEFDELYGYNPEKAQQLLTEAGYPNGFEFNMWVIVSAAIPENPDIMQAMALDFEAIGLKPKLIDVEYPNIRPIFRAREAHGYMWMNGPALRPLDYARLLNIEGGVVYAYTHAEIDDRYAELQVNFNEGERARLLQEIGDHKFDNFASIPMFWLRNDMTVDPEFIGKYDFPGPVISAYSHLEYIELADR